MANPLFDTVERRQLGELFDELGPDARRSSSRGRRAISLRTWCSANATTSPHLGSSCPVRGAASQNDEEQHSRARTFPGSFPRSDRGRHEVSSASVGCGAFPTSTSSLSTTRMCAEQTVVVRGRTRPIWMWLYGTTSVVHGGSSLGDYGVRGSSLSGLGRPIP